MTPPIPLTADQRTDAALQLVLQRQLDSLLANVPGVRDQVDTEFLHDLRVAVRRARSLLGQVRGVFPARRVEGLRADLGWLGRCTNAARDMDVFLLALDEYTARLPPASRPHLAPFRRFLTTQRVSAYAEAARCFECARYRRMEKRWHSLAHGPLPRKPTARRALSPVGEVARKRVWRAYRRLMKLGSAIGPESPARDLHAVRIAGKKLRYLMESFRSLFPRKALGTLIRSLKTFQDNLGEMQDLQVQQERLRGFGKAMADEDDLPAQAREAMDRLVRELSRREARVRLEFAERFQAFSAPETVGTFRETFRARPGKDR